MLRATDDLPRLFDIVLTILFGTRNFSFLLIVFAVVARKLRLRLVAVAKFSDFADVFTIFFFKQIYPSNLVNISSFDTHKYIYYQQHTYVTVFVL